MILYEDEAMNRRLLVPWLVVAVLLISCSSATKSPAFPTEFTTGATQEIVTARASEVLEALSDRDMERLSALIHPVKGVRFSPYAFVSDSDLVFTADLLAGLLSDPTEYLWGAYDGTGYPIEMTFDKYYGQFVYDRDYVNAEQIGYNKRIGFGNSIDNSLEYYPGANVVEYHFSGFDPDFGGMDWSSLRLVFQKSGSVWYLVGVIHDRWTI